MAAFKGILTDTLALIEAPTRHVPRTTTRSTALCVAATTLQRQRHSLRFDSRLASFEPFVV